MNFRITSLLISSLFVSCLSFGQSNYLPGYIIQLNGDTLRGAIDYRNWGKNPSVISFQRNPEEEKTKYGPLDIKRFVVADEIYESAIVAKGSNLNYVGDFQYDHDLKLIGDTIFLQTLIDGDKKLLYLKDGIGKEYFYIKEGASYTLLVYKRYMKTLDGKKQYAENRTYIGQIIAYLNDCPKVQSLLKDTKYKMEELEKLFLEYYQCKNVTAEFHKEIEKSKPKWGMLLGATNSSFKIPNDFYYLSQVDFGSSTNIAGGIFCDLILPRSQGKWSFNTELIYTSYKMDGRYEDAISTSRIELGFAYLKLNGMLRYTHPIGRVFIFTNGGLSYGHGVGETNKRYEEANIFHPPMSGPAILSVRGSEFGYFIGIGSKFNRYSLQVRYEKSNGFSGFIDVQTPTQRLYLLLGYRFRKG